MQIALTVFGQLVALYAVMLVGYIMTKVKLLDGGAIKGMSSLVTTVGVSISIVYMLQIPYSAQGLRTLWLVFLGMAVSIVVGCVCGGVLFRALRYPRDVANMLATGCGFANTVFIGRPIMLKLYGDEIQFILSAIFVAFNLLCFSLGLYMITSGQEGKQLSLGAALRRMLLNPVIIGGCIGFVLFAASISLPGPILDAMKMVNDMLSPLAMVVVGYSLANMRLMELFNDRRVYLVSFVKLLVVPIVTLLLLKLFIQDEMMLYCLAIAAATPVANTVGVMAQQYDNNPGLASKIVFGSTLLCVITAPIIMYIADMII